jgi:branched-chain amino acid transport system ATP-binding protein
LDQSKNTLLKVEDLSVSYGSITALNHVSINVNKGEIVTLIGANGAGKSTLLGTVLGIYRANSGTIFFLDNDITLRPTESIVASGISIAPEGRGIFPSMTVWENLQLGAFHNISDASKNLKRVFGWFPILAERSDQIGGLLSGGEQQMLSLGRALMSSPKLLMLDEPSLGLSPLIVAELFKIIGELNKEGYAILLSEQNARKSLQCAHRGYVMETGEVVLHGTTQELLNNKRVRQAYLGG